MLVLAGFALAVVTDIPPEVIGVSEKIRGGTVATITVAITTGTTTTPQSAITFCN